MRRMERSYRPASMTSNMGITQSPYIMETLFSPWMSGAMTLDSNGVVEGGVQGDTIVFFIGTHQADQLGTWQTGTNVNLNLTASSSVVNTPVPTFTPTVTPTPTITETPSRTPTPTATPGLPKVPVLVAPVNGSLTTNYRPKLDWKDAPNAQHYHLQVATSSSFGTTVIDQTGCTGLGVHT